jgi:hypothetical protein
VGENMEIKKYITVFIIVVILLLSFFSSIPSQSLKIKSSVNNLNKFSNIEDTKRKTDITLNILISDEDGNVEKTIKSINKMELDKLNNDLMENLTSDLGYIEKFEYVLQKLKDNNLVSNNIELNDVIDFSQYDDIPLDFNNVTNKNFLAYFAPIIILGGGVGIGLGYLEKRLTNAFTHFFALLAGAALVLCLDILNSTLYILLTLYFLPMFMGYMAGFSGIVMFAVYPGLFYMNVLMLGFAPFAVWRSIPEAEF